MRLWLVHDHPGPDFRAGVATMVPGVSEKSGGVTSTILPDRMGSMKGMSNAGAVTETAEFDAFGKVIARTNPSATQKGFAGGHGYQEDGESGYKLLGHRYYDAETGRFLSRDPIGDGRNWYVYCDSNPLKRVDPNGLGWHNPGIVYVDPGFRGSVVGIGEPDKSWGKTWSSVGIPRGYHSNPNMDVDLIIVTGKDGVKRVYFLMGNGWTRGLNGFMSCGVWDTDSPDHFYVDANGGVHGPNVVYLGTLEDVQGDPDLYWIWGQFIDEALRKRIPKNRLPEQTPCYSPGHEPWRGSLGNRAGT